MVTPELRARRLAEARWAARLSDGRVVQADEVPDPHPWLWLAAHVRATGLRVEGLALRFRSREVRPVPDGAPGYFFRHAAGADLTAGVTVGYFLVGHLDAAGALHVQRWLVPALLFQGAEARDPADPERVGPSLIRNP